MPSNALRKLVSDAKRMDLITLPPEAMEDLRFTLRSNDKEPNRRARVSVEAFLDHLKKEYKLSISDSTLRVIVRRELKRTWVTA